MMKPFFFILLLAVTACQRTTEKLTQKQFFIFGTIIDVLVWHDDVDVVEQALLKVEEGLNAMHHQWHAWKAGRLNDINQSMRAGRSHAINRQEQDFILKVQRLSTKSQGYFNPAIGELINLWGFHTDDYPITQPPPAEADIKAFLENIPTMQDVLIAESSISSKNRHIWLDFGGIAKGYAIDQAIDTLESFGINNAIVNAGGDLRSIGAKGQNNWRVAIRKPNSVDVLAVIEVNGDESIFTSGNYERYKEFDGKRHAHIINPFNGYGIEQVISTTVITDEGTKADAAATALIIAGLEHWRSVAQSMEIEQVLMVDAEGNCHATKKMMVRIKASDLQCQSLHSQ